VSEPIGTSDGLNNNLLGRRWLEGFLRQYPEVKRKRVNHLQVTGFSGALTMTLL
jgi:hypothetical protein